MFKVIEEDHPLAQEELLLRKITQCANDHLAQHGLLEKGWSFKIDRALLRVGQCRYKRKEIAFSYAYIHIEWAQIEDTILHEIAHALVPGAGHNWKWKAKCREIGARPERLAPPEVKTNAKPNYMMQCPVCQQKWYRIRMRKRNFGNKCPDCGTVVTIYKFNRGG